MPFSPTHQNLVMSSFILWLQNLLIKKEGYTNIGAKFYEGNQTYSGYRSFYAAQKPIIFDNSYSGPNIMTGIYFNNSYLTLGTSGFAGVDYLRSAVYFTGSNTPSFTNAVISGNYSVLDYNVMFPAPDAALIFEGKYELRPKTSLNSANITGLKSNEIPFPVILCRSETFSNKGWCFGGTDLTTTNIGCYVFSDNLYSFDALRSILVDEKTNYFSILSTGDLPTTNINALKNGQLYSYTGKAALQGQIGSGSAAYINDVIITDFNRRGFFQEVQNLSSDVYFGIVEFEVSKPRLT